MAHGRRTPGRGTAPRSPRRPASRSRRSSRRRRAARRASWPFVLTPETVGVVSGDGGARTRTRARRRSRRSPRSAAAADSSTPPRTSTAASAPSYDYGHYGVLLKQNVKAAWQRAMVQERDDIVLLDSAIILHPAGLGRLGPRRRVLRSARRLPHLQAPLPRRPPRRRRPAAAGRRSIRARRRTAT